MLVQQLPIYNKTRMFARDFIFAYEKMRNLHKHRLGAFVYDRTLRLAWYLKKANRHVNDDAARNGYIEDYLDELDTIANALRLAFDCRIIDVGTHSRFGDQIAEMGKQATAWKNKRTSNRPGCPPSTDAGSEPTLQRAHGGRPQGTT